MNKAIWSVHQVRGFTLIELMVSLSVLAIITMIATPSLASALENQKLKQAAIDLKIGLQQARSQAVLTSSEQVVCPLSATTTQASCGAALHNYRHLNDMQKNQKITLVEMDPKVKLTNSSAQHIVFSAQGYTTEQTITLCARQRSYAITVYMPGHVDMVQGAACS